MWQLDQFSWIMALLCFSKCAILESAGTFFLPEVECTEMQPFLQRFLQPPWQPVNWWWQESVW